MTLSFKFTWNVALKSLNYPPQNTSMRTMPLEQRISGWNASEEPDARECLVPSIVTWKKSTEWFINACADFSSSSVCFTKSTKPSDGAEDVKKQKHFI